MAASHWPRICFAGAAATAALVVVHRHDGDDVALALARPAGSVAARGEFQLCRSDHLRLGSLGSGVVRRRCRPSALGAAVRREPGRPSSQRSGYHSPAALCPRGASAAACAGGAERLRPVERAGAGVDGGGLRLSNRPVFDRALAGRHCSQGAVGVMANDTRSDHAEPRVLDQPWRLWSSIAVLGILFSGILLGVLIIPVVQGRSAGIDAYTAICRALGLLPGSPAQPQPLDKTPPTPVSQVIWTPDVLQIL